MSDDGQSLFSMHRLMKLTEIEAFSAQKNAGTKGEYFHLLDEFLKVVPSIVGDLVCPASGKEVDAFLKKIHDVQKYLLAIGSSTLLWEGEKVAESARADDKTKCGDRTGHFVFKIKQLCARLESARIDSASHGSSSADTTVYTRPAGGEPSLLPKGEIRADVFEKLCALVENFEMDRAIGMLRALRQYTYSDAIDPLLVAIYNDLTHFDHDDAVTQAKVLVDLVREAKPGVEEKTGEKKKILAVDDVPDVLNMVKSILKESYAVYGVTNHMAALKFLTNNSADLILLDIEMPDMSGFELLGIIRKIKAYENTPVLFLTGSVTVENIVKSRQAGGNDFLKKPIDAQVLVAKVGKHLGDS